ncbi:MAG: hypothetical protein H0V16_02625 [Burkholderiaceae bacterium]|nr:hypothetical protein [Burkholderiaceae bacterium]
MASARPKKQTLAIRRPVSVTVQRLGIQRADSVKYLDVAKLSRAAKAEFELGHIKIKGRKSTVRAVVRKGMVVAIRSELCAECQPEKLSRDLLALLEVVRRKIGSDGGSRRPVSVATFLQQQMPERSECHLICFWGMCFTCCGFPSDADSWSCSRLGRSYEANSL